MTTEEKIFIAASFDSEKIKIIRELMEDTWDAAREKEGSMTHIPDSLVIQLNKYSSIEDWQTNKSNKI